MADEIYQCGNSHCRHRTKCLRYSATSKNYFAPIGKQTKVLPAQRICDMYIPKPTE